MNVSAQVERPHSRADARNQPAPPAALSLVDTHIHLEEVPDWRLAVDEAAVAGISRLIAMGVDANTSRGSIAMAEAHPAVFAAVGHHPMNKTPPDVGLLRELAANPRVVAVGDVGLDHSEREDVGPIDA